MNKYLHGDSHQSGRRDKQPSADHIWTISIRGIKGMRKARGEKRAKTETICSDCMFVSMLVSNVYVQILDSRIKLSLTWDNKFLMSVLEVSSVTFSTFIYHFQINLTLATSLLLQHSPHLPSAENHQVKHLTNAQCSVGVRHCKMAPGPAGAPIQSSGFIQASKSSCSQT